MKKAIFAVVVCIAMLAAACASAPDVQQSAVVTEDYGAGAALTDEDLTLEEMLNYALQDEYFARRRYQLVIDTLGEYVPFTNIVRAEGRHIMELIPLFKDYGFTVPEDESEAYVVAPESLLEAGRAGELAEIDNIAMYERFMEEDIPTDVYDVFAYLREASLNHLDAFRRLIMREERR